ncbi:MAG: hypothetical protein ACE5I1_16980, partial [bacterium]
KKRKNDGEENVWPDPPVEGRKRTLVILVGTSFEPLLMAIWAYQPHRIVPVLNTYYGDKNANSDKHYPADEWWRHLYKKINRLPKKALINYPDYPKPDEVTGQEDEPIAVFNFLHCELKEDLEDAECDVIIDITGAKKTMVAGAYTFAAYTGAQISYVDFDRYKEGIGRPYGYTCRVSSVLNPVEDLALKQWESIRDAYCEYHFALALALLDDLPDHVKQTFLVEPPSSCLGSYFEICEDWENGDLKKAGDATAWLTGKLYAIPVATGEEPPGSQLATRLPAAIATSDLYTNFPTMDDLKDWLKARVLTDPELLVLHATDELERAKWYARQKCRRSPDKKPKIQEQYRLAFTKAYALYETLLKARALKFIQKGGAKVCFDKLPREFDLSIDCSEEKKILDFLTKNLHRVPSLEVLRLKQPRNGPNTLFWCNKVNLFEKSYQKLKIVLKFQPHKWQDIKEAVKQDRDELNPLLFECELNNYRNLIIHNYVPVDENRAKLAIELAEKSLNNYIVHWAAYAGSDTTKLQEIRDKQNYTIPSWQDVKEIFALDFLLHLKLPLVQDQPNTGEI